MPALTLLTDINRYHMPTELRKTRNEKGQRWECSVVHVVELRRFLEGVMGAGCLGGECLESGWCALLAFFLLKATFRFFLILCTWTVCSLTSSAVTLSDKKVQRLPRVLRYLLCREQEKTM